MSIYVVRVDHSMLVICYYDRRRHLRYVILNITFDIVFFRLQK